MGAQWYIAHGGNRIGPFSGAELKLLATSGLLKPTDSVWTDGFKGWVEASRLAALFPTAGQTRYWLTVAGKTRGPFPADRIRAALVARQIAADTPACLEGNTNWAPLGQLADFRAAAASAGLPPVPDPGVSQPKLLTGTLDAEEAALYLAGKSGDATAKLLSTLISLKKAYATNQALADSLEQSIQVLKARREQTGASRTGG
jgi:hypothetical protein